MSVLNRWWTCSTNENTASLEEKQLTGVVAHNVYREEKTTFPLPNYTYIHRKSGCLSFDLYLNAACICGS